MPENVHLTELQIDLIDVLWEGGEASVAEVREAIAPRRDLAYSTVATILARLGRRGLVTHRKVGRQYVYSAAVSRGAVRRSMVRDLTRSLFGGDPAALVQHLVAAHEVEEDGLERIRALLDEVDSREE